MDIIQFHFNQRVYSGELVISNSEEPHFYWCFLDDEELMAHLGDCVAFKSEEGMIVPAECYPPRYDELIQNIKAAIEHFLQPSPATYKPQKSN